MEGSHARIDVKGGRVYVMDLGEAEAGTYMDDNMCATPPHIVRAPNVQTPHRRQLTGKLGVGWIHRVQIALERVVPDGAGLRDPIGCVASLSEAEGRSQHSARHRSAAK